MAATFAPSRYATTSPAKLARARRVSNEVRDVIGPRRRILDSERMIAMVLGKIRERAERRPLAGDELDRRQRFTGAGRRDMRRHTLGDVIDMGEVEHVPGTFDTHAAAGNRGLRERRHDPIRVIRRTAIDLGKAHDVGQQTGVPGVRQQPFRRHLRARVDIERRKRGVFADGQPGRFAIDFAAARENDPWPAGSSACRRQQRAEGGDVDVFGQARIALRPDDARHRCQMDDAFDVGDRGR